jgi:hypothetical protein
MRTGPFRSARRGIERALVPAAVVVIVVAVVAGTTGASSGPSDLELQAAARAKALAAKPYVPDAQIATVPRVLVAGDSVAWTFTTKGPIEVRYFGVKIGFGVRWESESKIGCGVARGAVVVDGASRVDEARCSDWPQRYAKQVSQFDPDLAVVMVGAWEVFDHRVDGKVLKVGTPEYAAYLRSELRAVASVLHRRGARVVFTSVPCYAALADTVGAAQRDDPARIAFVNAAIDDVATVPYVDVLDIGRFLCPGGEPRTTIDGITVRNDGVHFTKGGSSLMWDWLGPQLARRAFAAQAERRAP